MIEIIMIITLSDTIHSVGFDHHLYANGSQYKSNPDFSLSFTFIRQIISLFLSFGYIYEYTGKYLKWILQIHFHIIFVVIYIVYNILNA